MDEHISDPERDEPPYIFRIPKEVVTSEQPIDDAAIAEVMDQPPIRDSGLVRLRNQNAARFATDYSGQSTPFEERKYYVGFGATVIAIQRTLRDAGIPFPVINDDPDSIKYYLERTTLLQADPQAGYEKKNFLIEHERTFIESIDELYPGTSVPFIDGVVDAYSILSEAVHNRQAPLPDDQDKTAE